MKFKVKNNTTNKVEEIYANSEKEVMDSYNLVGHEIKILGVIDEEMMAQQTDFTGDLPPGMIPTPQTGIGGPVIPTPPPAPKEIKFKVNGTEVKLMPDGVYVKEWVDVKEGEFKVVSQKTGKEANGYKVQIRDWVKSEDE